MFFLFISILNYILAYLSLFAYIPLFFRWVQAECRRLGDTDNPEVSELLRTAVRCLNERPVLFKYCAEEVVLSIYHGTRP